MLYYLLANISHLRSTAILDPSGTGRQPFPAHQRLRRVPLLIADLDRRSDEGHRNAEAIRWTAPGPRAFAFVSASVTTATKVACCPKAIGSARA